MQLKYHQAIFDLLMKHRINARNYVQDIEKGMLTDTVTKNARIRQIIRRMNHFNHLLDNAHITEINLQQLNYLEHRFSVVLPPSVREWFSLNFVPVLMSFKSMGYLPIHKFRPISHQKYDKSERHDLWEFTTYDFIGQDVESIVFKIDEGDDPPVFVVADSIVPIAPRFSEFIYLFFWDWLTEATFKYSFHLRDLADHPGAPAVLALPPHQRLLVSDLRNRYQERHGNFRTRFYDDNTWIRIAATKKHMSFGAFHTRTAEQLRQLIITLWGENAPVFRMENYAHEGSRAVLEALRHEHIIRALREIGDWRSANELSDHLNANVFDLIDDLNKLVERGQVEFHPDNQDDKPKDNRYRLKPLSS
jgi:hypothetical protein